MREEKAYVEGQEVDGIYRGSLIEGQDVEIWLFEEQLRELVIFSFEKKVGSGSIMISFKYLGRRLRETRQNVLCIILVQSFVILNVVYGLVVSEFFGQNFGFFQIW